MLVPVTSVLGRPWFPILARFHCSPTGWEEGGINPLDRGGN